MALSYQWKWLRGQKLTAKFNMGTTAMGETYGPVRIASNLLELPTQGCELLGVVPESAAASATDVPVIISEDIFEVQVKPGTDLAIGAEVQVEADGSVDTLAATNNCVGVVVDYNPASGGIAHVKAVFNAIRGSGLNDAASKLPLAGGTLTGDLTMTDGEHIVFGTASGSKIGTAATQKFAFYGATPVVQPAGAGQAAVAMGNENGEISNLTFSADPTQAECEALRDKCEELADDTRAINVLLTQLRSDLVTLGLIKGSA